MASDRTVDGMLERAHRFVRAVYGDTASIVFRQNPKTRHVRWDVVLCFGEVWSPVAGVGAEAWTWQAVIESVHSEMERRVEEQASRLLAMVAE